MYKEPRISASPRTSKNSGPALTLEYTSNGATTIQHVDQSDRRELHNNIANFTTTSPTIVTGANVTSSYEDGWRVNWIGSDCYVIRISSDWHL